MLFDFITLIGGTFVALLPIANPFSTAPVFAAITRDLTDDRRADQARRACIYMAAVLLVALLAGALILTFFGISIHALRVAGGMVIARIGFGMLNPSPQPELTEESRAEAMDRLDIAFTPVAMPLLSGPGSIAVTIGMATATTRPSDYIAIAIGIALVALASWFVLHFATRVAGFLGVTGMTALTRVMGLLLVCVGVQFIFVGILEPLTSDEVIGAIVEAVRRAAP
jgi:multiple antibiotic resistance protein